MRSEKQLPQQAVIDLAEHMTRLKEAASQFLRDANTVKERGFFSPSEDDQVVHLWVSYHMARNALFERIAKYQHTATEADEWKLADFAVAYAAAVVLVDAGRFLRELFAEELVIRRKLNESYQLYDIPAGSFDAIQMSLSDPLHAIQLYQANHYFDEHAQELQNQSSTDGSLSVVLEIIENLGERLRVSPTAYAKARAHERAKNTYDLLVHGAVGQAIYAIQSWVSRWVGLISTQPSHQPALPESIKADLLDLLQPGDVLVTRKEHSLTNYFLPGYWPHAALYIGGGRVIEALADGVRERSIDSPFAADAIAAIRPLLATEQIDEALARAHSHVGKPYDFDFDFTRADRMVCTEVVYRSYEGIGEVQFELTRRAARQNLSAEDLLNLARRQRFFRHLAAFCPTRGEQLLAGRQVEALLRATVQT